MDTEGAPQGYAGDVVGRLLVPESHSLDSTRPIVSTLYGDLISQGEKRLPLISDRFSLVEIVSQENGLDADAEGRVDLIPQSDEALRVFYDLLEAQSVADAFVRRLIEGIYRNIDLVQSGFDQLRWRFSESRLALVAIFTVRTPASLRRRTLS